MNSRSYEKGYSPPGVLPTSGSGSADFVQDAVIALVCPPPVLAAFFL